MFANKLFYLSIHVKKGFSLNSKSKWYILTWKPFFSEFYHINLLETGTYCDNSYSHDPIFAIGTEKIVLQDFIYEGLRAILIEAVFLFIFLSKCRHIKHENKRTICSKCL